jgi:hypothetical protein
MVEFFSVYWPGIVAAIICFAVPASVALGCWRDHRRQMKLEANPHFMDEYEMRSFNRKRFNND